MHTHLKNVYLKKKRKKNFKNIIAIFKRNQYLALQEQPQVKIKLFILVVLSNVLPAPRKRTISTDTLENKK